MNETEKIQFLESDKIRKLREEGAFNNEEYNEEIDIEMDEGNYRETQDDRNFEDEEEL